MSQLENAQDLTVSRLRKTLNWKTPAETLNEHLNSLTQGSVATTLEPGYRIPIRGGGELPEVIGMAALSRAGPAGRKAPSFSESVHSSPGKGMMTAGGSNRHFCRARHCSRTPTTNSAFAPRSAAYDAQ